MGSPHEDSGAGGAAGDAKEAARRALESLASGACADALQRFVLGDGDLSGDVANHMIDCPICTALLVGDGSVLRTTVEQDMFLERNMRAITADPAAVPPSEEVMAQELKDSVRELQIAMNELSQLANARLESWGARDGRSADASRTRQPRSDSPNTRSRRTFLKVASAAMFAGALGTWGVMSVVARRPAPMPPVAEGRAELRTFAQFDSVFAGNGVPGIQSLMANCDEKTLKGIVLWIGARQHAPLYGDLVNALNDSRLAIRVQAASSLWNADLQVLKAFDVQLRAAESLETDQKLKSQLGRLVKAVEKS